ncbi:MAG: ferric reductase-like transmembrane domain-containing protein [Balneolales bacterium]|nr:ferric reductase-like transmembrane domain-containing protein [Balneolales bacterium]
MRYSLAQGLWWVFLFLFLGAMFLSFFASGQAGEYRGFWTETGAGLGFIGMALIVSQFLTTGRFPFVASSYGSDLVLHFHKYAGIAGVVLLLLHPLILIVANPDYLRFFNPADNLPRAAAMIAVSIALAGIIYTSTGGIPSWLSYEQWRTLHAFLAVSILFIGAVHGLQVGNYLETMPQKILWSLFALIGLVLFTHVRVIRPWLLYRRPYEVQKVVQENSDSCSVYLVPKGHDGMSFKAGQFAWFTIGDSPFLLQQNPFSFSSSDMDSVLRFTAQEAGDFTRGLQKLKGGEKAWIDGPYGSFTVPKTAKGLYFIAGGSGIGPVMSILLSMRDRDDSRPVKLIYGNPTVDQAIFYDELEALQKKLNLTVVHVLEETHLEGPYIRQGLIDAELIGQFLPDTPDQFAYYCCGPKPLMDLSEKALRNMGISWQRIIPERFDII